MTDEIYRYSEDSRFLGDIISTLKPGDSLLEVGVGNARNLEIAAKLFNLVVGTDLVNLRSLSRSVPFAELIMTDRASCFRSSTFDVVLFNPPYLPSETIVDKSIDGGPDGIEVAASFLESALEVVKEGGRVIVLLSSEGNVQQFINYAESSSMSAKKIAERDLFFETLQVYELKKKCQG